MVRLQINDIYPSMSCAVSHKSDVSTIDSSNIDHNFLNLKKQIEALAVEKKMIVDRCKVIDCTVSDIEEKLIALTRLNVYHNTKTPVLEEKKECLAKIWQRYAEIVKTYDALASYGSNDAEPDPFEYAKDVSSFSSQLLKFETMLEHSVLPSICSHFSNSKEIHDRIVNVRSVLKNIHDKLRRHLEHVDGGFRSFFLPIVVKDLRSSVVLDTAQSWIPNIDLSKREVDIGYYSKYLSKLDVHRRIKSDVGKKRKLDGEESKSKV